MMEATVPVQVSPPPDDAAAESFRGFEKVFRDAQVQAKRDLETGAAELRTVEIKGLLEHSMTDSAWHELLNQAREAAEHGAKQYLLLRFPSGLCTDNARAINNPPNPDWSQTLRGEAAAIYERWHVSLRPLGFGLSAQMLDFPGGKPGDVGLFLFWGE